MRSSTPLPLALAVLFAACGAPPPPPNPAYSAREVRELARWEVFAGAKLVGRVVQFEIEDPTGPLPYYRIEDPQGRWVGHATANGRFSRRVPFQDDEQDLGVWPMVGGVTKLLEASEPVQLRPVAVEADARRGR